MKRQNTAHKNETKCIYLIFDVKMDLYSVK